MLNRKEHIILSHLRSNARKNAAAIAREARIPLSTVADKIKRLEAEIIAQYSPLLDFRRLGYDRAKVFLKVGKEDKEKLISYLLKHPAVNSVYKVSNRFDVMLEVVFKRLEEYYAFLEELKEFNIQQREEFYIIEDVKREGFLLQS